MAPTIMAQIICILLVHIMLPELGARRGGALPPLPDRHEMDSIRRPVGLPEDDRFPVSVLEVQGSPTSTGF
jgi:hypothetical protein